VEEGSPQIAVQLKGGTFSIVVRTDRTSGCCTLIRQEDVVSEILRLLASLQCRQRSLRVIGPEWVKSELLLTGTPPVTVSDVFDAFVLKPFAVSRKLGALE
jgi:hypothetical protein